MEFLFQGLSQESLWLVVVFYDLLLVVILYKFFGKYGLYTAVILGIILGNLQGGKVSEFVIFDTTFTVSMGAILYSGIYFSTDLLNEKYGKMNEVLEKPVFFDSVEVRQVIADIRDCHRSILIVANKLTRKIGTESGETEEKDS